MLYGQRNVPTEFTLRSTGKYENVFNDVDVDVVFAAPDGKQFSVPAFWGGDNRFRVRFAASEPGCYTYRTECSFADDEGLHGQEGQLEVLPYEGDNPLYRHGRLRVAASHRTLEHEDGKPFLWIGDTWWFGLIQRLDWPHGFQRLAEDRARKGFNAIQIVAGPLPNFDAINSPFDPMGRNEAGLSWENEWKQINPGFFDLADLRLAHLVECGLVPCIAGMWGYYLRAMGVERAKRHWRYLVARYGAYPVVWCSAGEVDMPTFSLFGDKERVAEEVKAQKEGWTEVTRYLRALDPYHSIITVHPSQAVQPSSTGPPASPDARAMLHDESLLDFNMLQCGHSNYRTLEPSVQRLAASMAKQPPMPAFIGEVNSEGVMGASGPDVQRFLVWSSLPGGACGFTYGAQGIWSMNSAEEPQVDDIGDWGDGFWQDVMHYSGSTQVPIARRLFERYPWWLFEPRHEPAMVEAGRHSMYATGIPGKVAIFYCGADCMTEQLYGLFNGKVGNLFDIAIEPGANYEAFFFNPRTGDEVRSYSIFNRVKIEMGSVEPRKDGFWTPPAAKPSKADWVLVLEDKGALRRLSNS